LIGVILAVQLTEAATVAVATVAFATVAFDLEAALAAAGADADTGIWMLDVIFLINTVCLNSSGVMSAKLLIAFV